MGIVCVVKRNINFLKLHKAVMEFRVFTDQNKLRLFQNEIKVCYIIKCN